MAGDGDGELAAGLAVVAVGGEEATHAAAGEVGRWRAHNEVLAGVLVLHGDVGHEPRGVRAGPVVRHTDLIWPSDRA